MHSSFFSKFSFVKNLLCNSHHAKNASMILYLKRRHYFSELWSTSVLCLYIFRHEVPPSDCDAYENCVAICKPLIYVPGMNHKVHVQMVFACKIRFIPIVPGQSYQIYFLGPFEDLAESMTFSLTFPHYSSLIVGRYIC